MMKWMESVMSHLHNLMPNPILKYQCQWPIPTRNRTLFLITLFCHVTLTLSHLLPNPILKDQCQWQIPTLESDSNIILPRDTAESPMATWRVISGSGAFMCDPNTGRFTPASFFIFSDQVLD